MNLVYHYFRDNALSLILPFWKQHR